MRGLKMLAVISVLLRKQGSECTLFGIAILKVDSDPVFVQTPFLFRLGCSYTGTFDQSINANNADNVAAA